MNGRPSPSPRRVTSTPRSPSAPSSGRIGRAYACSSPSKATGPSASTASGGTNRITVPARPQSTVPPPVKPAGGVTRHPSADSSMSTPRRPQRVAHQRGVAGVEPVDDGRRSARQGGQDQRAVRLRLGPGMATVAVTGTGACGAGQGTGPRSWSSASRRSTSRRSLSRQGQAPAEFSVAGPGRSGPPVPFRAGGPYCSVSAGLSSRRA